MANIFKPPAAVPWDARPSVVLAGSIDMGTAIDWQSEVERGLAAVDCLVLDPRRDDWDSSWEQSIQNAQFRAQVEWELEGLERATVIAMYVAPDSKAPITLLELGLVARANKAIVCAPKEFWRSGNVHVVCE